jgi:hypothetical protein
MVLISEVIENAASQATMDAGLYGLEPPAALPDHSIMCRFAQKTARHCGRDIVVAGDGHRGIDAHRIGAERARHRRRNVSSLAIGVATVRNESEGAREHTRQQ